MKRWLPLLAFFCCLSACDRAEEAIANPLNKSVSDVQSYKITVVLDTPQGEVESSMVYGIRSTCQDNPLGKRICSTGVRSEAIPIEAEGRTFFLITGTPEDEQQLLLGWKDSFENPGEFPLRFKREAIPELVEFSNPKDFMSVKGYGRYTPMPDGYEFVSVVRTKSTEPLTDVIEKYLPWADGTNKNEGVPSDFVKGTLSGYGAIGGSLEVESRMRFQDFSRRDF